MEDRVRSELQWFCPYETVHPFPIQNLSQIIAATFQVNACLNVYCAPESHHQLERSLTVFLLHAVLFVCKVDNLLVLYGHYVFNFCVASFCYLDWFVEIQNTNLLIFFCLRDGIFQSWNSNFCFHYIFLVITKAIFSVETIVFSVGKCNVNECNFPYNIVCVVAVQTDWVWQKLGKKEYLLFGWMPEWHLKANQSEKLRRRKTNLCCC